MNLNLIGECEEGNVEQVNKLLKAGADPNQSDEYGDTSLYWASAKGHLKIVELLLKAGVNPKHTNKWGETPLHYAVIKGCFEIVKLLLKSGVNPKQTNKWGETPLYWAIHHKHLKIIELLKSYKNKVSSLSLLCLRTIYQKQINTDNIPIMILEWDFHQ